MVINLRTPKYYTNPLDGLKIIDNYSSSLQLKWTPELLNEIREFVPSYSDYNDYFMLVDLKINTYLKNQFFELEEIKSLYILRERLLRILNPKIQLFVYHEPRDGDNLHAIVLIYYLDETGQEIFKEIDVTDIYPLNLHITKLREKVPDKFYYEIKLRVFEFLISTLEIPNNLKLEDERLKLTHYEEDEQIINHCLYKLKESIDKLSIDEFENINPELMKSIKAIKSWSNRAFSKLESINILDTKNIRK